MAQRAGEPTEVGRPSEDMVGRWNRTFSAAAEHFDDEPVSFFARFGAELVARCGAAPGDRVLDVGCGTGHAALAAAEVVGRRGRVVGADLAAPLLDVARAKASARGVEHVEFVEGDFRALGFPDGAFDVVLCSFAIFLVPDMPGALAELWRMVAPGGRLGVTSWGPELFQPAGSMWWEALKGELAAADVPTGPSPRAQWESPEQAVRLFAAGGIDAPITSEYVAGVHRIRNGDEWWTIVMGTGLRDLVDRLEPAAVDRVRVACAAAIDDADIHDLTSDVIYTVATKPA
jgi:ubiquinone/menaquinone biosynthesis C-methylase UbiE